MTLIMDCGIIHGRIVVSCEVESVPGGTWTTLVSDQKPTSEKKQKWYSRPHSPLGLSEPLST